MIHRTGQRKEGGGVGGRRDGDGRQRVVPVTLQPQAPFRAEFIENDVHLGKQEGAHDMDGAAALF